MSGVGLVVAIGGKKIITGLHIPLLIAINMVTCLITSQRELNGGLTISQS
jgi:hypothetical protein